MMIRLNSGNACYHSVQNLLPSRLLSKNLNFKVTLNYLFYLLFYMGVKLVSHPKGKTWLEVFKKRVLRTAFKPKSDKVTVKLNVKLSLCLTKHHVMKTYWGVEV
jgi:hypothetical protein